jgi:hypothetical protein
MSSTGMEFKMGGEVERGGRQWRADDRRRQSPQTEPSFNLASSTYHVIFRVRVRATSTSNLHHLGRKA